jgi:steroid delta-isomerase-like uncharacterized protein
MSMSTSDADVEAVLDRDFLLDWLQEYICAWNAHDVERILALYTEDVVYVDPSNSGVTRGRAGVRRFLNAMFGAFDDLTVELLGSPYVALASAEAAAAYRFTATMRGYWAPQQLAATGARVDVEGVSNWRFRGELASSYTTRSDMLDVARQLGVLPPIGSFGDRLATRFQHVQARVQRRRNARRVHEVADGSVKTSCA